MTDNKKISSDDPSRWKSQYIRYRETVEATKNFSEKLQTATENSTPNKTSSNAAANASASEKSKKELSSKNTEKEKSLQTENNINTANSVSMNEDFASSELSPKMTQFIPYIKSAAQKYNLPSELIAGIIWQESRGNPKALSHCGAMGLMQLMPETAAHLGVQNAFDPAQNIEGGSKYIRQMIDRFNGKVELAVAAYNAGPGNVEKYGRSIPPFKETQEYVPRVLGYASNFKASGLFIESTTTMRA